MPRSADILFRVDGNLSYLTSTWLCRAALRSAMLKRAWLSSYLTSTFLPLTM